MNLNSAITQEQLRDLLRRADDTSADHVLWVSVLGDVQLEALDAISPAEFARQNADKIAFRLETLGAGNDWVGPRAAQDDKWIERLYQALVANWEKGTRGYVDSF
jgi:hypothetical protein